MGNKQISGFAIICFILGIFSIIFAPIYAIFFGYYYFIIPFILILIILGIIYGIIALRDIKRNDKEGKWLAIIGIILSALPIIILLLAFIQDYFDISIP